MRLCRCAMAPHEAWPELSNQSICLKSDQTEKSKSTGKSRWVSKVQGGDPTLSHGLRFFLKSDDPTDGPRRLESERIVRRAKEAKSQRAEVAPAEQPMKGTNRPRQVGEYVISHL